MYKLLKQELMEFIMFAIIWIPLTNLCAIALPINNPIWWMVVGVVIGQLAFAGQVYFRRIIR